MSEASYTHITSEEAQSLAHTILADAGYSPEHVEVMAQNMILAQAQECHSHGLYRLISTADAANHNAVATKALPDVVDYAPAFVKTDAKGGCSLLGFAQSIDLLEAKAKENGLAALAINNCYHYSALWYEVEQLSQRGLVALAMTVTHPFVAPYGGIKPLLGTNPIAFSWPRPGQAPYTFDFATSMAARGEVEIKARRGETLPDGWTIDDAGNPTTDPQAALTGALLTFGAHKGSAISTMVELMSGPMIGDLLSHETAPAGTSDTKGIIHGEFVLVVDPETIGGVLALAEPLFEAIAGQGARLPSQRRRQAEEQSKSDGLRISTELLMDLRARAGK